MLLFGSSIGEIVVHLRHTNMVMYLLLFLEYVLHLQDLQRLVQILADSPQLVVVVLPPQALHQNIIAWHIFPIYHHLE